MYIERWFRTPVSLPDGTTQQRDAGTPQGGVISPLLANLFLHYVFDEWMRRTYPGVPFERYADDVVCHCRILAEAEALKAALEQRMAQCLLALHPQKTKVVYFRDDNRRQRFSVHQFDFLGFCFRPRFARSRVGSVFASFLPAISPTAAKAIRQTVRRSRLHCRHPVDLMDLAQEINPVLKGWLKYYGRFYRSALYAVFDSLDQYLVRWVRRKYKRLKDKVSRARELVVKIRHQRPGLCAHWIFWRNTVGNRSRMNREIHIRFCEGLRVRLPWATHLRSSDADVGIVNNLSVGTTARSGGSAVLYNVFSIFEFNL